MSLEFDTTEQANSMCLCHLDAVYSFAMMLTRNHADAEDLVQETFVRAIQATSGLRTLDNIKGWLFTITRNIWLNQLRKLSKTPPMVDVEFHEEIGEAISNHPAICMSST